MSAAVHCVTVTAHNVAEWTRAAASLQARGEGHKAETLRRAAESAYLSPQGFDVTSDIYRDWLVFDRPQPASGGQS